MRWLLCHVLYLLLLPWWLSNLANDYFLTITFRSRPCPSGKSGHGQKISDRTIYTICRWACIVIGCLRHYVLQCMDTITGFSCASCPVLFTSPERIIRKWCALLRANVSDLLIYVVTVLIRLYSGILTYALPVKLHYWIFDTCQAWHGTPAFLSILKTMFRIL